MTYFPTELMIETHKFTGVLIELFADVVSYRGADLVLGYEMH
jgi:hypothetical protein